MRWTKHFSLTSSDDFIVRLEAKFGIQGYARFWKLIETVAARMEKKNGFAPQAALLFSDWCSILHASGLELLDFIEFMQAEGKIKARLEGLRNDLKAFATELRSLAGKQVRHRVGKQVGHRSVLYVSYPNMLKYKDEHSRKSGVSPDKLPPVKLDIESERSNLDYSGTSSVVTNENIAKPEARSAPKSGASRSAFQGQILIVNANQDAALGDAFPWVERRDEYCKADSWLLVNPTRRPKSQPRFLHNWFSKVPKPNGTDKTAQQIKLERSIQNVKAGIADALGADNESN